MPDIMVYKCQRCGYEVHVASWLTRHLKRKNPCQALLSDAPATDLLDNHLKTVRKYNGKSSARQITNIHNDNSITNNLQTNVINVVRRTPFGMEEVDTYIGEEEMRRIIAMPMEQALREYVRLRNFNHLHPDTMNVWTQSVYKNLARKVSDDMNWITTQHKDCAKQVFHNAVRHIDRFMTVITGNTKWTEARYNNVHKTIAAMVETVDDPDSTPKQRKEYFKGGIQIVECAMLDKSLEHYPNGVRDEPLLLQTTQ
jgi:hypothetical protein